MKLFVEGRKHTFAIITKKIKPTDTVIWFHVASLGEYEQGLPIIKVVKELYPNHKVVLSFFSPSGYEVKKTSALADAVVYLPIDTAKNAREFLDLVHPELAFFVKYDFWPNFLKELKKREIRSFLISGGFRESQYFFKSKKNWFNESLQVFEHFFVQNNKSKELLNSIGFKNVTLSGDTRFDRVVNQLQQSNKLEFVEEFVGDKLCLVAGSTWPEEEEYLMKFIAQNKLDLKIIIAPHFIDKDRIRNFVKNTGIPAVLFSEKEGKQLRDYDLLIVDTVGLLTKIYSYADIAFVGGSIGNTGLHNILEPATFGIPIITGANFEKFPEAIDLSGRHGLSAVQTADEFILVLNELLNNPELRLETGNINKRYIEENVGATQIVENYLRDTFC